MILERMRDFNLEILLPVLKQGNYVLRERLHKCIGKEVIATQRLNPHHDACVLRRKTF
jgi:hypothetical protein